MISSSTTWTRSSAFGFGIAAQNLNTESHYNRQGARRSRRPLALRQIASYILYCAPARDRAEAEEKKPYETFGPWHRLSDCSHAEHSRSAGARRQRVRS